uniref:GLOBIN domain-containing protein n=1 Tax=Loa loa TaxID=7209 RepID=A0A1I7VLJ6_LOALO
MGNAASSAKRIKSIGTCVSSGPENPFEIAFVRRERACLHESFQPFDAERSSKVAMPKLPKLSGHIARFTDCLDQLTNMIGYTENLLGAWQMARNTGRAHSRQPFLEMNQNKEKNYFAVIGNTFINEFIPYLNGEKEEPSLDKKKVRFASTYSVTMITDVWQRFFTILVAQITESFEQERKKRSKIISQKILIPHQLSEENARSNEKNRQREHNFIIDRFHPNKPGLPVLGVRSYYTNLVVVTNDVRVFLILEK